jgi:hypothetical protein
VEDKLHGSLASSVATVFSLTLLGTFDEVVYFPSLLMSRTFHVHELALGAFLAALAMVLIIVCALQMFKPVLDLFDRVPLFVVVSLYAVIMTCNALGAMWERV